MESNHPLIANRRDRIPFIWLGAVQSAIGISEWGAKLNGETVVPKQCADPGPYEDVLVTQQFLRGRLFRVLCPARALIFDVDAESVHEEKRGGQLERIF